MLRIFVFLSIVYRSAACIVALKVRHLVLHHFMFRCRPLYASPVSHLLIFCVILAKCASSVVATDRLHLIRIDWDSFAKHTKNY